MNRVVTNFIAAKFFGRKEVFKMLYVLGIVFLCTNCQSPERKRQIQYYTNQCTHVDSIHQYFFKDHDPEKYIQNICNVQSRMDRLGLKDSAEKLLNTMQAFANTTKDHRFMAYHYLNYAYHYLTLGQYDSARRKYQFREKYAKSADIHNQLMALNFLGSFYYMVGEIDSARIEFVRGYRLSKEVGDTIQQFSLALNAGAAYHDLGMYGAASYYFSEAFSLSKKNNKPSLMLLNNWIASLTSERKYQRVLDLCEENREQWMNNTRDKASVLIKLNYASVLSIVGDEKKCDEILKMINVQDVDPLHLPLFRSIELDVMLDKGDIKGFKQHIDTLKSMIYENQPRSIVKFKRVLLKSMNYTDFPLSVDSFQIFYNQGIKDGSMDWVSKVEYASLLAGVFRKQGKRELAELWDNRYMKHEIEKAAASDSLRVVDIDVQMDQTSMKNAMIEKQLELERKANSNRLLTYLLIFLLVLLISAIVGLALYMKNGKKRNNIIVLEAKLVKQELEMLRQEKELKENVVAISQTILEQISGIGQRLKTADFAKHPEAVSIRLDLERLTKLSQSVVQPSLSEVVYESYDYLFTQYPELDILNLTERRILILTVLGNKPKEIAALLNLNDQYIRNVKSKIKKLFSAERAIGDWSDLKRKL